MGAYLSPATLQKADMVAVEEAVWRVGAVWRVEEEGERWPCPGPGHPPAQTCLFLPGAGLVHSWPGVTWFTFTSLKLFLEK